MTFRDYCGYCGYKYIYLYAGICEQCQPLWEIDNPDEAGSFEHIRSQYNLGEL